MKFNPDIHTNTSNRLTDYDYSSAGLYFITLAIQNKLCLLGEIKHDKMIYSPAGMMVENQWNQLGKKFPNIALHEYIVMPNHFHGIIEITKQNLECDCSICRDTPCGYPDTDKYSFNMQKNYFHLSEKDINVSGINIQDTHKGCPYNTNSIGNIIGGFKSKTTHEYIQGVYNNDRRIFNKKLWQKDFYEHIIRDEKSYVTISEYIKNNPIKWEEDKFYYTQV